MIANTDKSLTLGTAQWAWTVNKEAAFQQLDAWILAGQKRLDLATNYPINKIPQDFRAAEKVVLEYIQAHGIEDLELTMKIGSQNNLRTPEINLSPSYLLMIGEEYHRLFGDNLRCLMVHWDNRSDEKLIRETLESLGHLQQQLGLRPGISGIKHPNVYLKLNETFGSEFDIQFKHNVLHSDLPRYAPFKRDSGKLTHNFFAYGLNAGGLKLEGTYPTSSTFLTRGGDPEKARMLLNQLHEKLPKWNTAFARPPINKMNHIGLIYAGLNPMLDGLVLGFSSVTQMQDTLNYWRNLETFDYVDVFESLEKLIN